MLFPKALLEIIGVASLDETRYVLNGVHLERDKDSVKATATDGRVLLQATYTPKDKDGDFPTIPGTSPMADDWTSLIVAGSAVKAAIKAITAIKNRTLPILKLTKFEANKDGAALRFITTDLDTASVLPGRQVDGTFPKTAEVLLDAKAIKYQAVLNLKHLKDLVSTLEKMGAKEVAFGFAEEAGKPVDIRAKAPDFDIHGAIMPMRLTPGQYPLVGTRKEDKAVKP